jgi:hypothetical protein
VVVEVLSDRSRMGLQPAPEPNQLDSGLGVFK